MRQKKLDAAPQPPQPISLRPRQVAAMLGIGLSTLWVWTKRPGFPRPRKIGQQVTIFDRDELITWRDAQVQPNGPTR